MGCLFIADRHRNYVKHIRTVHPNQNRVVCKFNHQCRRQYSSVRLLIEHIKEDHFSTNQYDEKLSISSRPLTKAVTDVNQECRCDLRSCDGKKFPSLKLFMKHFNTSHLREPRVCIFEGCNTQFNLNSTSRHHFRLKHVVPKLLKLKDKHVVQDMSRLNIPNNEVSLIPINEVSLASDMVSFDQGETTETYDETDLEVLMTEGVIACTEMDKKYHLDAYADFMNRMHTMKYVPKKTMQIISSEYLLQNVKSLDTMKSKLRMSLSELGLDNVKIEEVIDESVTSSGMISAQEELDTEYKRTKYIKENFKYVEPKEIVLNPQEVKQGKPKEVLHYISVVDSFKMLLEDDSFIELLSNSNRDRSVPGILRDIKDGSAYKSSEFFIKHPSAMVALFYSDALGKIF